MAILQKASTVITPDAGPAHLTTAVGTTVIGIYANINQDRARPYLSADFVVISCPDTVNYKYGKVIENLPWRIRVRDPGL